MPKSFQYPTTASSANPSSDIMHSQTHQQQKQSSPQRAQQQNSNVEGSKIWSMDSVASYSNEQWMTMSRTTSK